jgi:hypothetical protein
MATVELVTKFSSNPFRFDNLSVHPFTKATEYRVRAQHISNFWGNGDQLRHAFL